MEKGQSTHHNLAMLQNRKESATWVAKTKGRSKNVELKYYHIPLTSINRSCYTCDLRSRFMMISAWWCTSPLHPITNSGSGLLTGAPDSRFQIDLQTSCHQEATKDWTKTWSEWHSCCYPFKHHDNAKELHEFRRKLNGTERDQPGGFCRHRLQRGRIAPQLGYQSTRVSMDKTGVRRPTLTAKKTLLASWCCFWFILKSSPNGLLSLYISLSNIYMAQPLYN